MADYDDLSRLMMRKARKRMSGLDRDIAPMVADELKRYMPDLVEVVRCKDCYHYCIVNQPYDEPWCSVMEDSVPTDGYCYHGRRREVTE